MLCLRLVAKQAINAGRIEQVVRLGTAGAIGAWQGARLNAQGGTWEVSGQDARAGNT